MTTLIELDDLRSGYVELVDRVTSDGIDVAPRGLPTRELTDVIITLRDPVGAVPVGVGRRLNLAIASSELMQLIGGFSDAAQLVSVSPTFASYMDGPAMRGAYGPRAFRQFPYVIECLSRDSESRQGCVTIWRGDELQFESRDVPCTLALSYRVVNGRLHARTLMRSNDVWLGVPYDFAVFTGLQRTLAWTLGLDLGTYTHYAWSLHIYERDLVRVAKLHVDDQVTNVDPVPALMTASASMIDTHPGERHGKSAVNRWLRVQHLARIAGLGLETRIDPLPKSVEVHRDRLTPHWSHGLMCQVCRYVYPRAEEFFQSHHQRQRYRGVCKTCRQERYLGRTSSEEFQERRLARRCAQYGITPTWFREQLDRQNHMCAICHHHPDNGRWRDFVIDHDHETGRVRGLLCSNCNQALGLLEDDVERVEGILDYLDRIETDE